MASLQVGDRGRCVMLESPMGSAHVHPGPYYPILGSRYGLHVLNAAPSSLYHQARKMVEEHIAKCEEKHGENCFEEFEVTLAPAERVTFWLRAACCGLGKKEGDTKLRDAIRDVDEWRQAMRTLIESELREIARAEARAMEAAFGQMRVDDSDARRTDADEIGGSATTAPPPADEEAPPHPTTAPPPADEEAPPRPRRSSQIAAAADGPVTTAAGEPPAPAPMPARSPRRAARAQTGNDVSSPSRHSVHAVGDQVLVKMPIFTGRKGNGQRRDAWFEATVHSRTAKGYVVQWTNPQPGDPPRQEVATSAVEAIQGPAPGTVHARHGYTMFVPPTEQRGRVVSPGSAQGGSGIVDSTAQSMTKEQKDAARAKAWGRMAATLSSPDSDSSVEIASSDEEEATAAPPPAAAAAAGKYKYVPPANRRKAQPERDKRVAAVIATGAPPELGPLKKRYAALYGQHSNRPCPWALHHAVQYKELHGQMLNARNKEVRYEQEALKLWRDQHAHCECVVCKARKKK
eukprot:COSAG02_NODE_1395_length_12901_cov_16.951726_7_plen_517_part_00